MLSVVSSEGLPCVPYSGITGSEVFLLCHYGVGVSVGWSWLVTSLKAATDSPLAPPSAILPRSFFRLSRRVIFGIRVADSMCSVPQVPLLFQAVCFLQGL